MRYIYEAKDFLFTTLIAGFPVAALSSEDEYAPRYVDVIVVGAGAGESYGGIQCSVKRSNVCAAFREDAKAGEEILSYPAAAISTPFLLLKRIFLVPRLSSGQH